MFVNSHKWIILFEKKKSDVKEQKKDGCNSCTLKDKHLNQLKNSLKWKKEVYINVFPEDFFFSHF